MIANSEPTGHRCGCSHMSAYVTGGNFCSHCGGRVCLDYHVHNASAREPEPVPKNRHERRKEAARSRRR